MPVQVWAQGGNLQTSYGTLNIWVGSANWPASRYQILGQVASIVVTDPRAVGVVLPTTRLQEETAIFPDAMESRTLQWRLPDQGFLGEFPSKSGGGTAAAHERSPTKGGPLNIQYNSSRPTFW